jgi:hypothetical protein
VPAFLEQPVPPHLQPGSAGEPTPATGTDARKEGSMAELKTKQNRKSVAKFMDSIEERRREDARRVLSLMQEVTGEKPVMWGDSIVGFGSYHYKYESGREGDWFVAGFSPRKSNLTLYIMSGFSEYADLMKKLGKHKTGKSCLYINRLDDIDTKVLRKLVKESVAHVRRIENKQNG